MFLIITIHINIVKLVMLP